MFKILHVITKDIDGSTHRHFFRIEKRPRMAFVMHINLIKEDKEVFSFRVEVESLSKDNFNKFDKDGYFGTIHVDTKKELTLPDRYSFTVRYGPLYRSKSTFTVENSGKYEDVIEALKKAMDGFNEEIQKKQKGE